jgi:hypothetical protein
MRDPVTQDRHCVNCDIVYAAGKPLHEQVTVIDLECSTRIIVLFVHLRIQGYMMRLHIIGSDDPIPFLITS